MKKNIKSEKNTDTAVRTKKKNLITGAVILAFALIGVITVISLLISLAASIFDNSEKKKEFENFISPVVMVDPVAFSDVIEADEHVLLMSSMWNLLMNISDETSYPEDEYGMMIIPSSDLDVSAASLFGSNVKLSHQTFGNTSITFEYSEENNSYIVPPMGYTVQYQPRVEKIKHRGKKYTLTVAYIASSTTLTKDEEVEPDKYMYYVLEKISKGKYIIKSIKDSPNSPDYVVEYYGSSGNLTKTETESDISKTESDISKTESNAKQKTSSK